MEWYRIIEDPELVSAAVFIRVEADGSVNLA